MALSLRSRILAILTALWMLLAVVGAAGMFLLLQLGGRIGVILKENYDSVRFMERLHESLERIDSSFQFAIAGRLDDAKEQYAAHWPLFNQYLQKEQKNITLPGEAELVEKLADLSVSYRRDGDAFFRLSDPEEMRRAYFGDKAKQTGLYQSFKTINDTAMDIMRLNQDNMEQASADAKESATQSVYWFAAGLTLAAFLGGLLAWHMLRTVLEPIRALRRSAQEIAAGNLDQVLPASSGDEVGELSQSFNTMARHLREFRQSQVSKLLRAQRTSQATIDSFPDAILVLDARGDVEMANPAARSLLGVSPRIDGHAVATLWAPPKPLQQPLADALSGQRNYLPEGFDQILQIGGNGQNRAVLPRILTIRDSEGNMLGAAVVLQDVTGLQILDEMKSNLVATVSHELKTPLTGIRLVVHLLLDETVGPLNAKQTELLLDARENSERLLRMIENLLNLARFEQGRRQLNFTSETPKHLLQAAADNVEARAHDKGVKVVVESSPGIPNVDADLPRMQTALTNLLDNALNYTDRGGQITLRAETDANNVILSVVDTGRGIPALALPHVFEKFFRVPGQSLAGGTGLGLAIVREIVVAHGGTVTCESQPDKGTIFRIMLPAAAQDATGGLT
jgi:NtrC-family two-component system sensor histidine kinase KinB